ncbi:SGNH/GDSL hydrolase family protein [Neolewinella aurantiaca]|uniref:SGNH/GDSL hydrolase family protein n=1 Tax=Neolewinella aurantiaca TaxID=2602767 RepID=A0A5C7FME5_9BACT|nr:SGNH/GDSL hydrolase family protein [Neolewinella aurantiaca]TXF91258.1 SGNH/GDSL hydrolase family protein [Neolewinella aurantiaca]
MKLLTILLWLPLFIFACNDDDDFMPIEITPPTDTTDTISFLALGDSYTIGTAVADNERWPALLTANLLQTGADGKSYSSATDIVATNGWTTRDLINGIGARSDLRATYDLVSLLIGVNNQFQGRSLTEYRTEFEDLLNQAIVFAGNNRDRVFVVSIPDYAFTGFGGGNPDISEGVRQFNAACREITESYGIPFINITPISQEGIDDPSLVATDNLHPSGKQYQRWVDELIEDQVREILSN